MLLSLLSSRRSGGSLTGGSYLDNWNAPNTDFFITAIVSVPKPARRSCFIRVGRCPDPRRSRSNRLGAIRRALMWQRLTRWLLKVAFARESVPVRGRWLEWWSFFFRLVCAWCLRTRMQFHAWGHHPSTPFPIISFCIV